MFNKPKYFIKNGKYHKSLKDLICIPVVNKKKQIVDLEFNKKYIQAKKNTVFLMAGGKGTRLLPLTQKYKPLLKLKEYQL